MDELIFEIPFLEHAGWLVAHRNNRLSLSQRPAYAVWESLSGSIPFEQKAPSRDALKTWSEWSLLLLNRSGFKED
ncbi:MAG: hypothetical protein PHP64_02140 [Actinomycetota bacterium]|nr:hypothetical protein [Actinomycetota bacterium]